MELIPIQTPILKEGDDLASVLSESGLIQDGDILVISSKAVATAEGAAIEMETMEVTEQAKDLAEGTKKSDAYYQVVLNETARMNGSIIQSVNGVVLTELKPDGMEEGSILVPNAGLDRSNIKEGYVIGWPEDPVASLRELNKNFDQNIALVLTDSGLSPRRRGITAFALAAKGIDPVVSMRGTPDLFGTALRITEEAVADQLATAANFLMGNSDQSIPAVTVRDHGIAFSDFAGWVPGIVREEDIYHGVI